MTEEKYNSLIEEIVNFIKDEDIDSVANFLNDLKFDVLEGVYEKDNDIQVVKRGVKIEPFSKEKLSENLSKASDYISDEMEGDVLDIEQVLVIVEGIVEMIKSDGKKVVSSDEIVKYTQKYLEENGYGAALDGYTRLNDRRKKNI